MPAMYARSASLLSDVCLRAGHFSEVIHMKLSRPAAAILIAAVLTQTACGSAAGESSSSAQSQAGSESVLASSADASTETAAAEASSTSAPAASSSSADSASTSEEPPAEVPAEAMEDVVAYLTDGAHTQDEVIFTIQDVDVTAAEVFYDVAYQYYSAAYYYYYSNYTALDLSADTGDGVSYADHIFEFGVNAAVDYAAAALKAKEMGIELPKEDQEKLATYTADNITHYGETLWNEAVEAGAVVEADFSEEEKAAWIQEKGEAYYYQYLAYFSTNAEAFHTVNECYAYFSALRDNLFGEGGEYAMSDEDANKEALSYIDENGVLWGRCILFSTQEASTDEEKAEVKALAEDVYGKLSELSGDALSESFTEFQTEYDKSGYTPGEIQSYDSSSPLVDGYYSGLEALKPGEVGITGETEYGYFVLLREEDHLDDVLEDVRSDYMVNKYQELLDGWQKEYGIDSSKLLKDVDPLAYFQKLAALQDTIASAKYY